MFEVEYLKCYLFHYEVQVYQFQVNFKRVYIYIYIYILLVHDVDTILVRNQTISKIFCVHPSFAPLRTPHRSACRMNSEGGVPAGTPTLKSNSDSICRICSKVRKAYLYVFTRS